MKKSFIVDISLFSIYIIIFIKKNIIFTNSVIHLQGTRISA
jgi:hypothetical protein